MEIPKIENISSYGKQCIGCERHKKDIMVSVCVKDKDSGYDFIDIFLTNSEAIQFHENLGIRIKQNIDYDEKKGL